jgi:hypothetical protein
MPTTGSVHWPRSSKPDHCPHEISPVVEARIISTRTTHRGWVPRTILPKLRKEFNDVPSRSAIYHSLVRQNLIQPPARRRRREDYNRWKRARSRRTSGRKPPTLGSPESIVPVPGTGPIAVSDQSTEDGLRLLRRTYELALLARALVHA